MNADLHFQDNLDAWLRTASNRDLATMVNALRIEFAARALPGMVQLQLCHQQLDAYAHERPAAEQSSPTLDAGS